MRQCFAILPSHAVDGGYIPALVTENSPGYQLMAGRDETQAPWIWGPTLELAEECAAMMNERRGISPDEAKSIIQSSMAASNALEQQVRNRVKELTLAVLVDRAEIAGQCDPGYYEGIVEFAAYLLAFAGVVKSAADANELLDDAILQGATIEELQNAITGG